MKQLFSTLIIFSLINCHVQRLPTIKQITIENLEPGKCYFTLQLENELKKESYIYEEAFMLEVIPPKYETVEISHSCKDLKAKMGKKDNLIIQTSKAHTKLIIKDANLSRYTTIQNPKGFMYCLVEVPPMFEMIHKTEFLGDSIKLTETKIIEQSKIIKTYLKRKPNNLKTNQLFFETGNWSKPRVAEAGSCDGMLLIFTVKRSLINLGYSLKLDNKLDEDTKKAIRNFQRNNNLKEGQLNVETLEKLGIDY